MDDPKFLVDEMFGNIARWLRILGFDTEYAKDFLSNRSTGNSGDTTIIFRAMKTGRIIITGDQELYQRAIALGLKSVFIAPNTKLDVAIAQIILKLGIKLNPSKFYSRCPICNGILKPLSINEARLLLPKAVISNNKDFWICSNCGKIYWRGSHIQNIEKTIRRILNKVESSTASA